jgi:hypothetical protein
VFRRTLFIDIDGSIFKHQGSLSNMAINTPELLPGVKAKFNEWIFKEYRIIIATGRPESMRAVTEKQLQEVGLFYHQLVMDCTIGERYVINDKKPADGDLPELLTAHGINLDRNQGFEGLDI